MSDRLRGSIIAAAVVAASLALPHGSAGQTAAASGYRGPRLPDGKPNLNGIWQVLNTAAWNIQDHEAEPGPIGPLVVALATPPGLSVVDGNEIPYQPWAAAKKKENYENRWTKDPELMCYLPGVPRVMYQPFPFQISQSPQAVVMSFPFQHTLRMIPTDGSKHPDGALYFWLGDPRGRWEGDTLVVDSTKYNDLTWFDKAGNFHSEDMHTVERLTPIDADHLRYEVTIEDPKVFTRPWKMSMVFYRRDRVEKNLQLLEFECVEWIYERDIKLAKPGAP